MRRLAIEGDKEVDLAALVDILSNMLFFLLATVSLLQLRTLNAAVPIENGDPLPRQEVSVQVEITDAGYVLDAHGTSSSAGATRIDLRSEIPRSAGALDHAALTRGLWEVKKQAPEQRSIVIRAGDLIAFEEIIATMDASREMPSIAQPGQRVPLFTRPVLSR